MTFEFYTKQSKYTVDQGKFFKDGDLIAEGDIFPFQVILGLPSWIIVKTFENCPPQIIKTDVITSILPCHEFFDGGSVRKRLYEVEYSYPFSKNKLKTFSVAALDSEHALQIFNLYHANVLFHRVLQQDKSYQPAMLY